MAGHNRPATSRKGHCRDPNFAAFSAVEPTRQDRARRRRGRSAVETAIHRWDAQHAVAVEGGPPPTPLDAGAAAAGIEEFVTEFRPGLLKSCTERPSGKVHLLLTDAAPKRWLDLDELGSDDPVHAHADATVRGTGSDVLLWLTNRRADSVDVRGDRELLEAWTRLKR